MKRAVTCSWRSAGVVALLAVAVIVSIGARAGQSPLPKVASTVIDGQQLLDDLRILAADDMQGRQLGTAGGLKARAYVQARFKAVGLAPFGSGYAEPFTVPARGSSPAREGANVVGHIDGRRSPGRYIVLSAHYDHVGVRNGQVFNGADDNASGTAALFALAQYFQAHPLSNSLLVVAFDGEEAGLLGSRAFLKAPPVARTALSLNVNADMVGRDSDNRLYVVGTTGQPFLKPFVDRVAAKASVRLLMGHDDPAKRGEEDWTKDSDHYTFLEAGIPALYVGVEDYRYHHNPADDFDSMTFDFYVRAVETIVQLVQELDANLDAISARTMR